MKNLTLEDIIYINNLTIQKHGGSPGINCNVSTKPPNP